MKRPVNDFDSDMVYSERDNRVAFYEIKDMPKFQPVIDQKSIGSCRAKSSAVL